MSNKSKNLLLNYYKSKISNKVHENSIFNNIYSKYSNLNSSRKESSKDKNRFNSKKNKTTKNSPNSSLILNSKEFSFEKNKIKFKNDLLKNKEGFKDNFIKKINAIDKNEKGNISHKQNISKNIFNMYNSIRNGSALISNRLVKNRKTTNLISNINLNNINNSNMNAESRFIINEINNSTNNKSLYNNYKNNLNERISFKNKLYNFNVKKDGQYINYLKSADLNANNNCFQIFSDETFYKDNSFYYLLLYNQIKIGTYFSNSISVINSLSYYPLENDTLIDYIYNYFLGTDTNINFILEKENSTFLHCQSKGINYKNKFYYFQIKNEKGETFIDSYYNAMSEYIRIEPFVKYYIRIIILKMDNKEYSAKREIMLNFQKYKNNFLVDNKIETKVRIYSEQNLTFFFKITDVDIGKIIFFMIYNLGEASHETTVYYNYYDSDNFEELINYFPTEKNKFDNYYGKGNVYFKILRKESSPAAILIGLFIKRLSKSQEINPFNISAKIEREEDRKKKTETHQVKVNQK